MNFFTDLAIISVSCLILGMGSKYLRQAAIPAYIIAGLALGKSGLDLISAYEFVQWLGKIGLLLLLFYIGYEFNVKGLRERGRLFAGITDFVVNFSLAFVFGWIIGLTVLETFILASVVYISSSAIVITLLIEEKRLIYPEAETIVWLMVFEDLVLAILLAVMVSITTSSSSLIILIPLDIALTVLFIVCISIFVRRLNRVLTSLFDRDDEIPILLVFALLFGFSALAYWLGSLVQIEISELILAFFIGAALSGVHTFKKLLGDLITLKNFFLTIFFFSFGIMLPVTFSAFPPVDFILVCLALIVLSLLGKFVSGAVIGKRLHNSLETGVRIGAYTTPRGEFSVILLAIALERHMGISDQMVALIVVYVILLPIIGSLLAKNGDRIGKAVNAVIKKVQQGVQKSP
jgi:CPA2 family monovalent cation:H+ antiporter-2